MHAIAQHLIGVSRLWVLELSFAEMGLHDSHTLIHTTGVELTSWIKGQFYARSERGNRRRLWCKNVEALPQPNGCSIKHGVALLHMRADKRLAAVII